MYKVSVVIPIYNVKDYIEECLESVLMQLPSNVQVICVNDGTQDESMDIAKATVSRYSHKIQEQFLFLDQVNQGLGAARNTGIDAATGDYISFLDSDDKLKSNYFSTILNAIELDDYDIIDFNFETSEGLVVKTRNDSFNSVFSFMQWYSWARVVKKQIFSKYRFTPGIYYEDIALTPKLYVEAGKTLHLDSALYWYRTNFEGITKNISHENNLKTLSSLDSILNSYLSLYHESDNPYYAFMAVQSYFLLCLNAARRFDRRKSFSYIEKYQEKINVIKLKELPVSRVFIDPKILVFYKHPKKYILGYIIYRKLKNAIDNRNT